MHSFYPTPTLVAVPTPTPTDGWLAAHIELLNFEKQHTREHPEYGRVIVLETLLQRDTYLRLLDNETNEKRKLTSPVHTTPTHQPCDTTSSIDT